MTTVPLLGGAYQGRSNIAAKNQCVNLYPETNPGDGQPPVPVTHYLTPGLLRVGQSPNIVGMRTLYRSSKGDAYAVVGPSIYYVSPEFEWLFIGSIADRTTPVSMADNGEVIVLVDGGILGYAIDIATRQFGQITDPSFYGGRSVVYLDTYFVFNRPDTTQFYISLSNVTFAMLTGATGRVLSGSIAAAGSGYVSATYTSVPLTGGAGSGAIATVVVTGGAVTDVTITDGGTGYLVGDVLSASNVNLGGAGSGFGYSADEVATAFDPLDIAGKTSSADNLVAVATIHGELWLVGEVTSEVWANSGASDFTFQRIQGAFVDHGCAAPYSIAQQDISLFWLVQDKQGYGIVVRSDGYSLQKISTYGIEQDIQSYAILSDAIGFCHQIDGHAFYVITFPDADVTWSYDLTTGQWHRRASTDTNGTLHRYRANCYAFAYGYNLVGDYQNGKLYSLDQDTFTDDGTRIPRIITFPHIVKDGRRVYHSNFQAKMEVGTIPGTTTDEPEMVSLRWSDTAGKSWGNAVMQSMGSSGQYLTSPQWSRLGYARDRVYELSWSAPCRTALNGGFLTFGPGMS